MELRCSTCNALVTPGVCDHCGQPVAEPGPGESVCLAHFLFWSSLMTLWAGELCSEEGVRPWVFPLLFLYGLYYAWHKGQLEEPPRYLTVEPRSQPWPERLAVLLRRLDPPQLATRIPLEATPGPRSNPWDNLLHSLERPVLESLEPQPKPPREKRWPSDYPWDWPNPDAC